MNIKSKITTIVIISSIVISVLLHGIYIISQNNYLKEFYLTKLKYHSNLLSNVISRPLYNYDSETISRIVVSYIQDEDLVYISVSDYSKGKIIEIAKSQNNKNTIEDKKEIIYAGKGVGEVKLKLSLGSKNRRLREYFRISLISLIIISIIQFSLLIITLRNIVNPINRLTNLTKEISDGNFKKRISIETKDEIGVLAKSFSKMQDSIMLRTRELESHKNNLEEIVEQRTLELKKTQEKLIESEKMASLAGMVAGIAHEINTPIGVGLTAASHLESETIDFKKMYDKKLISKSYFDKYLLTAMESSGLIVSSLNRASGTINSFKEVVIDSTSGFYSSFKILDYIKSIVKKVESLYMDKILNVEYKFPEKDFEITSDHAAISKVLMILLINSIQHGFKDNNGTVKIELYKGQDDIEIIYSDNGKGIDEKDLNKIFEPFYTTSRGNKNIGLGLSILYNMITISLGGKVQCKSKLGEGTTFKIVIPKSI